MKQFASKTYRKHHMMLVKKLNVKGLPVSKQCLLLSHIYAKGYGVKQGSFDSYVLFVIDSKERYIFGSINISLQ